MAITIDRDDLAKALDLGGAGIYRDKENTTVKFIPEENGVSITISNFNAFIRVPVNATSDTNKNKEIVVNGYLFRDIISKISKEELKIDTKGPEILISSSKTRYRLKSVVEKTPWDEQPGVSVSGGAIDGEIISKLFSEAAYIQKTNGKMFSGAVLFTRETGNYRVASTDGHRLGYAHVPVNGYETSGVDFRAVIPAESEGILGTILKKSKGTVSFERSSTSTKFSSPGWEFRFREADLSYPKVEMVIPKENDLGIGAIVDKTALIEALKLLNPILDDSSNPMVRFRFYKNGKVLIQVNNNEGEGHIEMTGTCDIGKTENKNGFALNLRYALDCFNSLPGEKIRIRFSGNSGSAIVFTGENSKVNSIGVIMPLVDDE